MAAQAESGMVRISSQQALWVSLIALITVLGWVYSFERNRIDEVRVTTETLRKDVTSIQADIAVLKAQQTAAQITLDRIDRRVEGLSSRPAN